MFSNIHITKIHDTSKYCISVGNLRNIDTVTYTQNAVQSAFCHPESLCRMIYAKLKTLPEGIRK